MPFLRVISEPVATEEKPRTPLEFLDSLRIVREGHPIRIADVLTKPKIVSPEAK